MNLVEQIKERLRAELGGASAALKAAFGQLKKFQISKGVVLAYDAITGVVAAVEEISEQLGGVSGAQKKRAVVEWLNEAIDIPLMPEFIEAWLFDFCVDQAVSKLNLLYQKRWFQGGLERARAYFALIQGALTVNEG